MKATLEFQLPEDEAEFGLAVDAPRLFSALVQIRDHVRSRRKHGDPDESALRELDALWELIPFDLTERD